MSKIAIDLLNFTAEQPYKTGDSFNAGFTSEPIQPEPYPENTFLYLDNGEVIELDITEITTGITNQYQNSLVRCVIGTKCTYIGDRTFNEFTNLIEVRIHDGVTIIDEYAFQNCVKLGGTHKASKNNIFCVKYLTL